MVFQSSIIMVINEVLWRKILFPILLVETFSPKPQNIGKCIWAIIYYQLSKTDQTQKLWYSKIKLEWLLTKSYQKYLPFPFFISKEISLQRIMFVKNLKTWVKFISTIIYDQFLVRSQKKRILVFDS